jgi:HlyD family secretion protein
MNKRRMSVWRTLGPCIAVIALLVSGCGALGRLPAKVPVSGGSAPDDVPPESMLTASGTIHAQDVQIASELGGRIVEVRAGAGDEVRAGEVLVVLDATQLSTKLAEAEAAVAVARADLAAVRAGPRVEEVAASQAMVDVAVAGRDGAFDAWRNALEAIENPQDLDAQIADASSNVKLAEQGVELAEAELAREQLLRDQRPQGSVERQIADLQVDAAENGLAAARADQNTAQTHLDWLWAIRSEPLALIAQAHVAEGQYALADAGVAVTQAQLDDLLAGPTAEEIAVAQAAVQLAQAEVAVLRAQQAKSVLSSPVDGVVLDQALQIGEVAAPAGVILTVANLNELTLVVYVPENRIGHVQVGQRVKVTVDSYPEKSFTGRVRHIGDEPEFTPRNVATQEERLNTFFAVEVRLPNDAGLLKPGMPADAAFSP